MVAACHYRNGYRGFSPSGRAGGYGDAKMWPHIDPQDASIAVIAMVEDREALEEIDTIIRVEGLDAVFIGRGDLTVVLLADSPEAQPVRDAVNRIMSAARAAGKPVCVMVSQAGDVGCTRSRRRLGFYRQFSPGPRFPAMQRFRLGVNASERDQLFSHVMTMEFDTMAELKAYLNHESHEKHVVARFKPLVEQRAIASYEAN